MSAAYYRQASKQRVVLEDGLHSLVQQNQRQLQRQAFQKMLPFQAQNEAVREALKALEERRVFPGNSAAVEATIELTNALQPLLRGLSEDAVESINRVFTKTVTYIARLEHRAAHPKVVAPPPPPPEVPPPPDVAMLIENNLSLKNHIESLERQILFVKDKSKAQREQFEATKTHLQREKAVVQAQLAEATADAEQSRQDFLNKEIEVQNALTLLSAAREEVRRLNHQNEAFVRGALVEEQHLKDNFQKNSRYSSKNFIRLTASLDAMRLELHDERQARKKEVEDLSKALAACKQQVSYYKSIASDQRDQIDRTVDEGTLLTESMMRERDAAAKLKQQRKDFQQQKRQWEASHMSPRIAKIHSSEGAFSTANFTDIDQQYSESEIGSGSPQLVLRSLSRNKPDLVIETKPPSKGNTYPPRSALRSGSPQVGYKRQSMSPYNKSSPSSTSRVSSIGVGIPKSLQHLESTSASRGSTPKKGLGTQQSPSKSPSSSKQSSRNSSPKSSARIPKTYQDKKDDQANENKYLTQGMLSRPYSTYEVVSPKHKVKPISYITDSLLNASSSRPSVEEKPMRSPNARAAVANATKSPKARNPRAETFGLTAAEIDEEQRSQASKRENSPTENSEYDSDFTFSSTMELLQGNASAYEVRNKSSSENEEEMSKIYRTIADKAIAGGFAKHENNKKVDPKLEDLLNQSAIVSDRFASNNIAVMDTINLDQSVFNTTNDDVLNSTKLRGVDNSIASVSSARSRQSSMKQAAAVGALVANSVVEKFNRLAIDYNKLVILYAQEIKECENMRMDFKGEIYAHVSKVNEMEERLHTISNENSHLLRQISELKEKSNYEDNLLTDAKASEKAENERFVNKLSKELDRLQRDLEEAVGTIEFQGERITRSQVVEISIGQVGHEKTNDLKRLVGDIQKQIQAICGNSNGRSEYKSGISKSRSISPRSGDNRDYMSIGLSHSGSTFLSASESSTHHSAVKPGATGAILISAIELNRFLSTIDKKTSQLEDQLRRAEAKVTGLMDQLSERTTATEETEAISRQLSTDKERMVFENKRYQKKLDELNKVISDSKTVIEENHKQMLENESRAEDLLRELSDREQKLADATREVHLKDKELTALSNRNNENIERIDNLTQDYETTLAQLKDREQILSVLTNKQDVNNTSVDSANAEISALRAQLDRMNSELEEAKDRYYNSNNHVELLLNTSRQATPKKAIQSISGQMNDFLEANSYNNMLSQSYPPPSGSQRNTPMKGNITVDDNILVADRFTMGIDLPIQSDSNSILSGHDSSENNEKKTDKVRPPRPSESPPRVNRKQSQSVDTYNNHSINNQKINQSANFDTTSSKASEPTLRNSRDGILASKLFQELEQRAKRAEIKCHLLTQQINSIPVSLAVAMAEKRVVEGKLAKAQISYQINLKKAMDEAQKRINELSAFLEMEKSEKNSLHAKLKEQAETVHQLTHHLKALQAQLANQASSSLYDFDLSASNNVRGAMPGTYTTPSSAQYQYTTPKPSWSTVDTANYGNGRSMYGSLGDVQIPPAPWERASTNF